jgi:V-type H+-transporting ATPase subunit a
MARWFRSEPMEYISLIVNEDAAHDCLSELGNLGVIQFTDVSNSLFVFAGGQSSRVSLLLPS